MNHRRQEPTLPTPVSFLPGLVWFGTAEGACLGVSPQLESLLRGCAASLPGDGWLEALAPEDREPVLSWLRLRAGKGGPFRGKISLTAKGRQRIFLAESRGVAPEGPFAGNLLVHLREVIRRAPPANNRAAVRAEQLHLCFAHAPVGIGFLDTDLRFIQANPFLSKVLTGFSRIVDGLHLGQVLRGQMSAESTREIERICSTAIQTGRPHALHGWPTGHAPQDLPRFADWEIRRIENAQRQPLGLLVTVSDVTRRKYVEEKVRLLASVLETTPDLVAVFSPEGNILYLNRSAKQAAGLRESDPFHNLHYKDLQPKWASDLLFDEGFPTALKEGIWEGETAFLSPEQGEIPVSQVLCTHANAHGEVEFISSILRDISEARHIRDQLASAQEGLEQRVAERTAALAEASAVIRDRVHQQAAVADLGEQALSGTQLSTLLRDSTRAITQILRVDFCSLRELSQDGLHLELRASTGWPKNLPNPPLPAGSGSPSGYAIQIGEAVIVENLSTERRFSVNASLLEAGCVSGIAVPIAIDNRPFGSLSVFSAQTRDFTENDAHFLQSMANVIAAAIQRQRTQDGMQNALEQAEAANRAKSAFLSRMSHELRTPLNAILGFAQLLRLEEPTPSQLESIEHINRAGKHLLSLINEVLDIAHIETGRLALTLEAVELNSFLHNCVELMRPIAARASVGLQFIARDKLIHVSADKQRLKQVVLNFLSNAIKYNNEGGEVLVSLRTAGETARFEVRDTGPGIPLDKRPLLFKPFERLGAEEGAVDGSGIGLALCKGFLESMDGEVGLDNPDGGGCVFWAQLPLAHPSDEPVSRTGRLPEALAPVRQSQPPVRLLYVESHDFDLQLMERMLQKHPTYELLSAMQGSLGLELAREHSPDLLLIDLELPDMQAPEFMNRLKHATLSKPIPTVFLTSAGDSPALRVLAQKYAAEVLLKPYSPSELLDALQRALERSAHPAS